MSADGEKYNFAYGPGTPYSHAVGLVDRWRVPGGEVVVDLGCGYGAIAEPVRDLGLAYFGVDVDDTGLRSLEGRGFQVLAQDVCASGPLVDAVAEALGGRTVAAITMLDSAEHLPNASDVLRALSNYATSNGSAPLVVSIPNVSHRDVAAKLLLGRWDVTPTGLLDVTHVRFFAPATLDETMARSGWEELGANDFEREESDQRFPEDSVALVPTTPVGALLRRIRGSAAPGAITNQFVRAYGPRPVYLQAGETGAPSGSDVKAEAVAETNAEAGADGPFLSIVVRTAGSPPGTLDALLRSLSAQRHDDYELVFVVPDDATAPALPDDRTDLRDRARVVRSPAATAQRDPAAAAANLGVRAARGRYVVILDPADICDERWVAGLADGAARFVGRVLDAGHSRGPNLPALVARGPEPTGTIGRYAFPRSVFADLGLRFDEQRSESHEWRLTMRAVEMCGIAATEVPDLLEVGATAPPAFDDEPPARRHSPGVLAFLDDEPLLLDRGSASLLASLHEEIDVLRRAQEELLRARDDLDARLEAMHASTSWRLTAPLRAVTGWRRR